MTERLISFGSRPIESEPRPFDQKPADRPLNDPVSTTEKAALSAPPVDVSELVCTITAEVLQCRIDLLGVDGSGAYQHYAVQLQRGFRIPRYETAVVDLVRTRLPDLKSYHEIGSGLGTLPFLLAGNGFAAAGIERDDRRYATAEEILQTLAVRLPSLSSNCRLIYGTFPQAVSDLDVSESMAIFTDFVSTHTPDELRLIYHGLKRYRYVLLDLQRFVEKRDGRQDQLGLKDSLAARGLRPVGDLIELGSDGCYCLFERETSGRRAIVARESTEVVPRSTTEPAVARAKSEVAAPSPVTVTPFQLQDGII